MNRRTVALRRFASRLRRDRSGLALLEFGLALPLVMAIGLYGIEIANLALMNLRVSQVALNLADNASRVGLATNLTSVQLREVDMNDVLTAAAIQSKGWNLTTQGRIIVSSLEAQGTDQVIHWQRCLGLKQGTGFDSSYGTTTATDGTNQQPANDGTIIAAAGMGDPGSKVAAPPKSGVMFVEVNYQYKPVVSSAWLPDGSARLHYTASFIVRDLRDFKQIYNPDPAATRRTCNLYSST